MALRVGQADRNILDFLKEYLQSRGLLRQDFLAIQGRKKVEYQSERKFWQDMMQPGQIYETYRVTLKDFLLSQWIPRAPGQFYTSEACRSRQVARNFIRSRDKDYVVFDPYGKSEMVKGGVGCLRLAQKQIGNESLHFLCATSSGVTHKGLLVGLRRDLYQKLIEDMERYGGVRCNILGQIRYWSCEDMLPIHTPRHLPRMYLYAEKLDNLQKANAPGTFDVTAAVLFRGTVHRDEGTFFVYSHFDPGKRYSLERTIEQCVNWMEKSYVEGLYQGRVLTDFDEVAPRFEDVSFPVRALMNPSTDASSIVKMCLKLDEKQTFINNNFIETLVHQVIIEKSAATNINFVRELTMTNGDTYHVNQAGAVGKYARSDNNTFFQSEQKKTLAEAAAEIQQLLKQLEQTHPSASEFEQIRHLRNSNFL